MAETKQIDPAALSTLLQGIVLCNFELAHEAAEWLAGHPVWAHQFMDKPLMNRIKGGIRRQFPEMSDEKPADWEAERDALRQRYGVTVAVERGSGEQPHILAGLPDHVEPLFIEVPRDR